VKDAEMTAGTGLGGGFSLFLVHFFAGKSDGSIHFFAGVYAVSVHFFAESKWPAGMLQATCFYCWQGCRRSMLFLHGL